MEQRLESFVKIHVQEFQLKSTNLTKKGGIYQSCQLILVLFPHLGDEVHAVPERGDEPNGGVPVEGHQLLLPHQPVDIPTSSPGYTQREYERKTQKSSVVLHIYRLFSLKGQCYESDMFLKV
jgi:hypothetical protein